MNLELQNDSAVDVTGCTVKVRCSLIPSPLAAQSHSQTTGCRGVASFPDHFQSFPAILVIILTTFSWQYDFIIPACIVTQVVYYIISHTHTPANSGDQALRPGPGTRGGGPLHPHALRHCPRSAPRRLQQEQQTKLVRGGGWVVSSSPQGRKASQSLGPRLSPLKTGGEFLEERAWDRG